MTGTIDVRINADHPDKPLDKHYVFVGSPDAPRIVNVPLQIGDWEITDVYVSTSLPDGTMHSARATLVDGTYVATLPKCDVVGVVEGGFQIVCDGTDESGEAFEGLCLGCGDLEVLPRNGQIHVGETVHFFRIVDTVPAAPKRGDATEIEGDLKWYDGTNWLPFGGATVVVDPTLTQPCQAADAEVTGRALNAKRNKTDLKVYGKGQLQYMLGLPQGWSIASPAYWEADYWVCEISNGTESRFVFDYTHGEQSDEVVLDSNYDHSDAGMRICYQRILVETSNCLATKYTDWVPTGMQLDGQPIYISSDVGWRWVSGSRHFISDEFSGADDTYLHFLDEEGTTSDNFSATRQRIILTSDISADNQKFAAAVEEVIHRINNGQ